MTRARVTFEPAAGLDVSGTRRTDIAFCPGGSWACAGKAQRIRSMARRKRFTGAL
jgi:hypothetical protein